MGPSGWANEKQRLFLKSHCPAYKACRVEKKYTDFWARLFNSYLAEFPLVEEMYPGRTVADLDETETQLYAERLTKLQSRLKEWFRWQYNPRTRNATAAITKKVLKDIYKPRTRGLKAYEIYAKLYPSKVSDSMDKSCSRDDTGGQRTLATWHAVCKELLANATEEEAHAVEEEMAARALEMDDDDDDEDVENLTPEQLQRNIDMFPSLLSLVLDRGLRRCGHMALVTLVGPIPEKNGQIDVRMLQFGDKPDTPHFARVWHDYQSKYVNSVSKFARHHEFPPEVCARRALHTTTKDEEEEVSPSTAPSLPAKTTPLVDDESPSSNSVDSSAGSSSSGSSPPRSSSAGSSPSPTQGHLGTSSERQDVGGSETSRSSPLSWSISSRDGSSVSGDHPTSPAQESASGGRPSTPAPFAQSGCLGGPANGESPEGLSIHLRLPTPEHTTIPTHTYAGHHDLAQLNGDASNAWMNMEAYFPMPEIMQDSVYSLDYASGTNPYAGSHGYQNQTSAIQPVPEIDWSAGDGYESTSSGLNQYGFASSSNSLPAPHDNGGLSIHSTSLSSYEMAPLSLTSRTHPSLLGYPVSHQR